MLTDKSSCLRHFGVEDFEFDRVKAQYPSLCPIAGCSARPVSSSARRGGGRPFCPEHGIRLHSNTFVYWNGTDRRDEARLRNFLMRPDLARDIALGSSEKAESHRLGHEMSEDALTWNVFIALAEAGKLRNAVRFLTGRDVDQEPSLYLWGELVDVEGGKRGRFRALDAIRERLERDIRRFRTEPDVMLVIDGHFVICVEAKFSSGNPVARDQAVAKEEKPVDRAGLVRRYLDQAGPSTRQVIDRDAIGRVFHSQLFRNVIFASEMANGCEWHVVNLTSKTQWSGMRSSERYSFDDPEPHVRAYLDPDRRHCFTFRTWEDLHTTLVQGNSGLEKLDAYMRSKSARYCRAFDLDPAKRE